MPLKIRYLRYFLAVSEKQSFTLASAKVNIESSIVKIRDEIRAKTRMIEVECENYFRYISSS